MRLIPDQSGYDSLTGLANRDGFNIAVRDLLDQNPDERFVLLYGDIDRFKVFNDQYGTKEGDHLLRVVGQSILGALPPNSVAARMRADHFACCMPLKDSNPERSLTWLNEVLSQYPAEFSFFVRLGVYEIEDPSLDVSSMTDRALLALKAAKNDARASKVMRFEESLREKVVREQELAGQMRKALQAHQFELYFQPQYRFPDRHLVGAEVLTRWNHPEKGLLGPAEFIPIFERTGLISDLDYYVWDQASKCLRTWLDEAAKRNEEAAESAEENKDAFDPADQVPHLSVNLSRADIYREDLCDYLVGLMKKYNLPFDLFHLEITESFYTEAPDQLIATVRHLQEAGFTVEMDDFGSGYSSLNALKDVPVDVLKLDLRFLDARNNTRGGIILASVVRMARWLDLTVVAEGVEAESQAKYLSSIGCEAMQGFWFSPPVPREQYETMMSTEEHGSLTHERVRRVRSEATQIWDAESLVGLLFSSFVGPAALAEYDGMKFEIVRANDEFMDLLGIGEDRLVSSIDDIFSNLSQVDDARLCGALERTVAHDGEGECELNLRSHGEEFWIRVTLRLLSQRGAVSSLLVLVDETTDIYLRFKRIAEQERQLYESLPCGVVRFTADSSPQVESANLAACRMLGCGSYAEFLEYTAGDALAPLGFSGASDMLNVVERLKSGEGPISFESQFRRVDGSLGWLEGFAAITVTSEGRTVVQSAFNDVTAKSRERSERAWQNERYRILSELTHAISFDYDSDTDTVLLYIDRTGHGMEAQVIPNYLKTLTTQRNNIVHPDSIEAVRAMFERVRAGGTNEIIEYRADYYGTGYQWYRTNLNVVHDDMGSWHLVGLIENIQTERELRRLAENDAVTGLSNHAATRALVAEALSDLHVRSNSVCAVIDVDNFKSVNDSCGHLKGDELLQLVGKALRENCRDSDVVGRVGGDEFVVLLKNISLEVALRKFQNMKQAMNELSFTCSGGRHYVAPPTISIGVAPTTPEDRTYDDVVYRADKALYESKRRGKNRIRVYKPKKEKRS